MAIELGKTIALESVLLPVGDMGAGKRYIYIYQRFGFSMLVLQLDSPRMLRETMNRGNRVSLFIASQVASLEFPVCKASK